MGTVKVRMLEVTGQVEKLANFNSDIFYEIEKLYGEESKEFKMIQGIDNKINDLLEHLNCDETES